MTRRARARGRLRSRLAATLIGLTVIVASLVSLVGWSIGRWIEQQSMQTMLNGELKRLVASYARPLPSNDKSPLRYFRPAMNNMPMPLELSALTPGVHSSVNFDGHRYRALVRDLLFDDRAVLLFNIDDVVTRQKELAYGLGTLVLCTVLLAWWLSGYLAGRALIPLDELVGEIRQLDPRQRGQRVGTEHGHELQPIAEALNAYMVQLDVMIARERAFAAAASHELRTPLAIIAGATELLEARPRDPEPAMARIRRAVVHARQDLDTLLAMARNETLALEPLNLYPLLQSHATAYLAAVPPPLPQLIWDVAEPVTVRAHASTVAIIFTNLLRNALQAVARTPQKTGRIEITLRSDHLSLRDNGGGIPAKILATLFEPWLAGRSGGTGIGLYIARTLAERLQWSLRVGNTDDGGGGVIATLYFHSATPLAAPATVPGLLPSPPAC